MSSGEARTRYCSRCLTTFVSDEDRCSNLGCRGDRPPAGWGELREPGELIDRTYRIHSRLAIGGAGVTYLAREVGSSEEVGPLVAVKVLYSQRDQGPYLRRLATEAQILQGLNHPQIVECRGFVHRTGHSPYLVTRFEAGGSLLDHIARVGLLSPRTAAAVAMQICDALAVAHRQGVIHRDLKPENVLLEAEVGRTEVPSIRVADFGIAKVFGGVGERLTRVGAFIGTPQYAAPEQFEGLAPEPATDVYAVGALLYFCITGRPVADLMAEIEPEAQRDHLLRHLPPTLRELPEVEARWIEESFHMAMAPDPGDRCQIDILAARLHSIALGNDPGRPPAFAVAPPWAPVPHRSHSGVRPVPPTAAPAPSAPLPASKPRPTAGRVVPALLVVVLVGVAAAGWWRLAKQPRDLTQAETDPKALADWRGIAIALAERGAAAGGSCASPPFLAFRVVVAGDGAVQSLDLLNYPDEAARRCIEAALKTSRFPRTQGGLVRVEVQAVK